jgi:PEP-CTERM motif
MNRKSSIHRFTRLAAACGPAQRVALAVVLAASFGHAGAQVNFPTVLIENGVGTNDSVFLGAPDDLYLGLGRAQVTYDFGEYLIVNRDAAVDLNVYEVDFGSPEFSSVSVLVSQDGVTFTSVKASEQTLVRITGDNASHTGNTFGKSYDLGDLAWARYVRIDGTSNSTPGGSNGFDLDAIGGHQVMAAVPEPATWALMMAGVGGLLARRRRVG